MSITTFTIAGQIRETFLLMSKIGNVSILCCVSETAQKDYMLLIYVRQNGEAGFHLRSMARVFVNKLLLSVRIV